MNDMNIRGRRNQPEEAIPLPRALGQVANRICESALEDARSQMHPLLRNSDLHRLWQRAEFIKAFKGALERRIAQRLAAWQPDVHEIFQFEESWMESRNTWDGSIHLLVKVPQLSIALKTLGKSLDKSLLRCLKALGWARFHDRETILEVQQVTLDEMRHRVSYGAMFCAVYSLAVRVWPLKRR